MSLHPLLPWPLTLFLAVLLLGFAAWRIIVDGPRRLRWLLRGGAAALVLIGLLGPAVAGGSSRQVATDVNVWFVVDTTTSSNARDYAGDRPRIEGYREDVNQIAQEMGGARFSVISFDQSARVALPLTNDTSALSTMMETLQPEVSRFSGGSSVSAPDQTLTEALQRSEERFPNRARVVFYLGDGEQTASSEPAAFTGGSLIDGGAVLGYGTEEGGPMASTAADGSEGEDITDGQGNPGISVIDQGRLEGIASELGVPYVHRDGGDIAPAMEDADPGTIIEEAGSDVDTYTSIVWILATVAVLLLLADVWLINREAARLRKAARA